MSEYVFCESATGIGPWHIRKLGEAGRKLTGGIDTPSLCDTVQPFGTKYTVKGKERTGGGGWDLDVPLTEHHLSHACKACVERYRREVASMPEATCSRR